MTIFTDAQLQTAQDVIEASIRENFPNVSVRRGTVMKELVSAALSIGYAVINEKLEAHRATQSLKYAQENPSAVDDSIIDAILSNYFLTRKQGTLASGLLKITVSTGVTRTIPAGTQFLTANELRFITETTILVEQVLSGTGSVLVQQEEGTGNWFFLIPVVAEAVGSQYSIAQDTQLDNSTLGADLILITAFTTFSGGSDSESTSALISRAQNAITVRDLTSRKSIRAVLPEAFPQIQAIQVIGYGDPEMTREHRFGFGSGGRVDIYTRTSKDPVEITVTKTISGLLTVDLETVGLEVPFYRITSLTRVEFPDTPLAEGVDYTLTFSVASNPQNDLRGLVKHARFTVYERAQLTFLDPLLAGKEINIRLSYPPDIQAIQNFVLDEEERVVLADLLVKGIIPVFVTLAFSYVKKTLSENTDIEALKGALKDYINALVPGSELAVSSLIDIIHNFGVMRVEMASIALSGILVRPDGLSTQLAMASNVLEIPEDLELGVSTNTVAYFSTLADIKVTELLQ
jgi:hypothetical protein